MDAQAIHSEHEAEASGPRSLNNRSSVRCSFQLQKCVKLLPSLMLMYQSDHLSFAVVTERWRWKREGI